MTMPAAPFEELRCPQCLETLHAEQGPESSTPPTALLCLRCGENFPVIDGIPRMLLRPLREALGRSAKTGQTEDRQVAAARSFGFEWSRFSEMRPEWERNFQDYLAPHGPDFFKDKRILEAGCGNGRHAFYSGTYGASLWAMDLGPAIEVARRNTQKCPTVHLVQADLNHPPFEPESFDFIYSIGVLHHLPDPEGAFQNLLRFLKPGGEIQIYLYWKPEGQRLKSLLLALVSTVRHVTIRIPHRLLYWLSYPAAWLAFAFFVWPYKILRRLGPLRSVAERLPMKQYASYPFRVCMNDQFDRFSAPIENRYSRAQVEEWFQQAGLEEIRIRPQFGWIGSGRKPKSQDPESKSE